MEREVVEGVMEESQTLGRAMENNANEGHHCKRIENGDGIS